MNTKLFQESVSKEAKKIISEAMHKNREVSIDEIKKLAETMGSLSSSMSLKSPEIHVFEEKASLLNENSELKNYRITLQHDTGKIKIKVVATSEENAIEQVLSSENAPRSAIKNIELLNEKPVANEDNNIKEKRTPDIDTINENKDLYHGDTKEKARWTSLVQHKKWSEDNDYNE